MSSLIITLIRYTECYRLYALANISIGWFAFFGLLSEPPRKSIPWRICSPARGHPETTYLGFAFKACLAAGFPTLIAVSKKKSHELIEIAFQNGVNNFGENYAQELEEKSSLINSSEIIWHFIGPIQSNKVKVIARCADWVHTLDRKKVVVKLNNECKKENKVIII